ncbi:hypothetical protein P879_00286 [Paragonimus westermani]|uniref:Uncharacterized protein n=1 Tax=Paragonimus westermani TaxID=34504 RepID=A0A8T0DZ17_9TREM|nr:hypothetical protein P879_00286 [Paragonimus westermani]
MEQQFSGRHGATSRTFPLGQLVLAKDYRDDVEDLAAGGRTRQVTYDVEMQSSIRVRHVNQLRNFFSTHPRPLRPSHSNA